MTRPLLLDLYCCAGGAAKGYYEAGFDLVGVDLEPQKNYPYEFHRGDALEYLNAHWRRFDAIHASPPCHNYSTGTQHRKNQGVVYPDLLPSTQEALRSLGLPYIIENVPGAAKLMREPVMLCGGMFGLGVMRHRYFESNVPIVVPEHTCNGRTIDRDAVSITRHGPPARWYRKNPGATFDISIWRNAMEIDWTNRRELTQAIPPAYTRYLGQQLLAYLRGQEQQAAD